MYPASAPAPTNKTSVNGDNGSSISVASRSSPNRRTICFFCGVGVGWGAIGPSVKAKLAACGGGGDPAIANIGLHTQIHHGHDMLERATFVAPHDHRLAAGVVGLGLPKLGKEGVV